MTMTIQIVHLFVLSPYQTKNNSSLLIEFFCCHNVIDIRILQKSKFNNHQLAVNQQINIYIIPPNEMQISLAFN
jgi:hypothetical protein